MQSVFNVFQFSQLTRQPAAGSLPGGVRWKPVGRRKDRDLLNARLQFVSGTQDESGISEGFLKRFQGFCTSHTGRPVVALPGPRPPPATILTGGPSNAVVVDGLWTGDLKSGTAKARKKAL